MRDGQERRVLEQLRDDGPELRQQDRDRGDAADHVRSLGRGVEPRRARRPVESVEIEAVPGTRTTEHGVAAETRLIRPVRDEARHRADGHERQEGGAEYGCEPRSPERAAPEISPERTDRGQPHRLHSSPWHGGGSKNWSVPSMRLATNTRPVRGSTATEFGWRTVGNVRSTRWSVSSAT